MALSLSDRAACGRKLDLEMRNHQNNADSEHQQSCDVTKHVGVDALICQRLGQNGLLQRYESGVDGLSGDEGAFGICSFWAGYLSQRPALRHTAIKPGAPFLRAELPNRVFLAVEIDYKF
jgi:hypothetical protein